MELRYSHRLFLIACLALFLIATVAAEDTNSDNSKDIGFSSVPSNSVLLKGTGTMVLQTNPNAPHTASGGGEAFFCEGDPDGDYVCSNSFATYGCNESCKCCYYEEAMEIDPDRQRGLSAPFRFIQSSQINKIFK